jgi:hypothetical protein
MYSVSYDTAIVKLGYKSTLKDTGIVDVVLWPVFLTGKATTFLVNNNYKPVKK